MGPGRNAQFRANILSGGDTKAGRDPSYVVDGDKGVVHRRDVPALVEADKEKNRPVYEDGKPSPPDKVNNQRIKPDKSLKKNKLNIDSNQTAPGLGGGGINI
tara:strand:- start:421 stop:726 length:306 start_codon:yes stop_codon:yes gene_type:complete